MVEKILPRAGLELGTARTVGQGLSHLATGEYRLRSDAQMLLNAASDQGLHCFYLIQNV